MNARTCKAINCNTLISPYRLMCWPHWKQVHWQLQDTLSFEYTPGQGKTKLPSKAYLLTVKAAINDVAVKESLPAPYPTAYDDYKAYIQKLFRDGLSDNKQ